MLMVRIVVYNKIEKERQTMKEIIVTGILLMLAGCGPAVIAEQTADPIPEGWHNPNKTDMQVSQDRDQCRTQCVSA